MSFQRHILKRYIVPTFDLSGLAGDTIVAANITIVNGGEGFAVGDVVEIAGGTAGDLGAVTVDTVDATNGAILTISDDTAGTGYTASVNEVGSILTSADTFVNADDFYTFDFYQLNSEPTAEAGTSSYSPAIDAATLNIGTHVGGAGVAWADPDNSGQRFTDNIPTVLVVRKGDQPQLRVQKTWIDGGSIEVFAEPGIVDRNGNLVGQELRAEDIVDQARCVEANKIWDTQSSIEQVNGSSKVYGFCREPLAAEVGVSTLFGATSDADCPVGSYWDGGTGCTAYTVAEVNDGTAEANEVALGRYDAQQLCLATGNHPEMGNAAGAVATYDVATSVASNGSISGGAGYVVGQVVEVSGDTGVTFTVDEVTTSSVTNDNLNGAIVSGTLTGTVSVLGDATYTDVATVGLQCVDASVADNFSLANFSHPTQSGAIDYARTTCKQYGFYWEEATRTCKAYTDPSTLLTKATCIAEGHQWIAGTCYDGADFGDGMNRVGTSQQDPTQKPN